jgi:hypothetical protein
MKKSVRKKTESRSTTTVTDLAAVRNRKKSVSPGILELRADISAVPRVSPVEISSGASVAPRDRVAELLIEMGFQAGEIGRIKQALPILPIDAELVGRARAFVVRNASGWNHETWLAFVQELAEAGYGIGVDMARYGQSQRFVGVLVEAIRVASFHAIGENAIVRAA